MGLDDAEDDADEDDEEEELVEDSPAAAKFKEMLDSMRERSLNKLFVAVRAFIWITYLHAWLKMIFIRLG